MTPTRRRLLERLVSCHNQSGDPVTPGQLATCLQLDPAAIESHLNHIRDCELVTRADDGYTPTVTAHELLALDLDDDSLLVVDVLDE